MSEPTKRKRPMGNYIAPVRCPRCAPVSGYAPILVMPLNTAPETVAEARAHGYLPILADDPAKVVLVFPIGETRVSGDMLMAALHGLNHNGYGDMNSLKSAFVSELHRRLLKQEGA